MKHSLSGARYSCKSRSTAIAGFDPSPLSPIMKTYNHSNTLNASQQLISVTAPGSWAGEEPVHPPPPKGWWCKFIQSHRLDSLLGRAVGLVTTDRGFLLQSPARRRKGTPQPPLSPLLFHITEEEITPVVCLLVENSLQTFGKALNGAVTILIPSMS